LTFLFQARALSSIHSGMEPARLRSYLEGFQKKRLLVIGDVMLDRFVWGNVSRISPEAPVPVVDVQRETSFPGGAANVARNLLPFCAHVSVCGLAGVDPAFAELSALLRDGGIDISGLFQDPDYPTIVKTRIIARSQQVVRIDRESRRPMNADLIRRMLDFMRERLGQWDAIIIEDYGKGVVTQTLIDGLADATREHRVIITVDPNPHNPLRWRGVTVVKPNRSEAFQAAGLSEAALASPASLESAVDEVSRRLFKLWDTEMLLVTLGEQGMALLERDDAPFFLPTRAREVFDVSGAGDTAIALFTLALSAGVSPREAAEIANHAAGVVVGKIGTATITPQELIDSFDAE
jgi:D-beta-D-heptose 7-phosphate kinase/D-beta-D-heptose 1-phosphate adenosyltransferase